MMSDLLDEHIERLTKLKAAMRLQQEEAHLRLITAQGQAEQYRNALKKISRPRYGLDMSYTSKEAVEYWARMALEYRQIAEAALQ